jgi:putative ABC transport system substrate-binding protein
MRRRKFIMLVGGAAVWPLIGRAQLRLPIVGWLGTGASLEDARESITKVKQGLAEIGLVEDRNFVFEYRWADYHLELMPALAADLVRRGVSVIAAPSTAAVTAAKAATQTIPIVFTSGIDPVGSGLVASLNRPGGNITGVTNLSNLLAAKRLQVLRELVPAASLFAILVNPNSPIAAFEKKELQAAAGVLGVRLLIVNADVPDEFSAAFATLAQQQASALLVTNDSLFNNRYGLLVDLAARHAIPTMYHYRAPTEAGGLMSYSAEFADTYHRIGEYIGRILKGEKPGDLPVQQATKIELIINLKTAKTLGLTIPETLLATANEVIE